jgi:hypothetical protein
MTAGPRRFSIEQAGRALGVSTATVRRMIRRPHLPPLTRDHPIFRLVGAGHGGGRAPGARDKHALLRG